jgi:hypothetical protein
MGLDRKFAVMERFQMKFRATFGLAGKPGSVAVSSASSLEMILSQSHQEVY